MTGKIAALSHNLSDVRFDKKWPTKSVERNKMTENRHPTRQRRLQPRSIKCIRIVPLCAIPTPYCSQSPILPKTARPRGQSPPPPFFFL